MNALFKIYRYISFLSKYISSIPVQNPLVTQRGRWLIKNASWLQNTQFFFPPSLNPLSCLSGASHGLIPVPPVPIFHFNSSHSKTRRENNVMYNFQCVSHLVPGSIPQWCLQSSRWHLQLRGRNRAPFIQQSQRHLPARRPAVRPYGAQATDI